MTPESDQPGSGRPWDPPQDLPSSQPTPRTHAPYGSGSPYGPGSPSGPGSSSGPAWSSGPGSSSGPASSSGQPYPSFDRPEFEVPGDQSGRPPRSFGRPQQPDHRPGDAGPSSYPGASGYPQHAAYSGHQEAYSGQQVAYSGQPVRDQSYPPPVPPDFPAQQPNRPVRRRSAPLVLLAVLVVLLAGAAGYLGARLGTADSAVPTTPSASPTVSDPSPSEESGGQPAQQPVPPSRSEADTVRIAEQVLPSTVTIRVSSGGSGGLGSGFVIDDQGRVMTNNHVVEGAENGGTIQVTFSDGRVSEATLLGRSPSYDLAVIEVADPGDVRPVRFGDSDQVRVGEAAVAIGSPLGLGGTVTEGIISATDRPVAVGSNTSPDGSAYLNALQTDAPINRGNSGGPLVDGSGAVIGVNSAILTGSSSEEESGNIGIGFAIPINQADEIGRMLIRDGHATYPVINASVSGDGTGTGVLLSSVEPGGAADRAGLQVGDVVTAVDGRQVRESEDLIVAVRNHRPGDTVTLAYRRNGSDREARVELASKRG